jgi:hypothetical protein
MQFLLIFAAYLGVLALLAWHKGRRVLRWVICAGFVWPVAVLLAPVQGSMPTLLILASAIALIVLALAPSRRKGARLPNTTR